MQTELESRAYRGLEGHGGWLLAVGIILIILGMIAAGATVAVTLASVMLYGFLLLIGGISEGIHSFAARKWSGFFSHLAIAILYVIAGGYMIRQPVVSSMIFTLVLGYAILITGICRIILAFRLHGERNWGWVLVSGIVAVLLGGIILARWPVSGLTIIGLFVAIELLINGWSLLIIGVAVRSLKAT